MASRFDVEAACKLEWPSFIRAIGVPGPFRADEYASMPAERSETFALAKPPERLPVPGSWTIAATAK
ncbi:hypothetical protein [uncultured Jannaschia sp.]|uniref:hypothetical protein n=1 Tax=uncultured Jannaschia sp. TaxID=293347 RepID=UPI0026298098|nr:hypothetical protein [uncultured Jannaschia sp.]